VGIHCKDSSPTIINNTIANNFVGEAGIYCEFSSFPTVSNTILWENRLDEIYKDVSSGIDITYSDIQGGWEGEGNINADPLFVNPVPYDGDYHLQAGSPCIDAGDPNSPKDPDGTRADMGAYYFDQSPLPGDVSGNGSITAYDASLVLQSVVGLIDLSERQKIAADVTGNGTVTALDAALILQYTVGLITQFPVQQGAPILTVKDENQILTKIIVELEIASLTAEQRHVLEQLKQLIGQQPLTDHTALLQNYPNPFNPETWIPYKLAKDASVTVRIYNVKGQLIRILHLSNKDAGVYMAKDKAAHWDGKDSLGQSVASGVYFYTLQVEYPDRNKAGIFTATRKMVIVK
jgi:hypothetical protein